MLERRRLGPYIRIQHSIPVYSVARVTVCWERDTVIYCMHRLVIGRRGHGPVTGLLRHHPPWRAPALRAYHTSPSSASPTLNASILILSLLQCAPRRKFTPITCILRQSLFREI